MRSKPPIYAPARVKSVRMLAGIRLRLAKGPKRNSMLRRYRKVAYPNMKRGTKWWPLRPSTAQADLRAFPWTR